MSEKIVKTVAADGSEVTIAVNGALGIEEAGQFHSTLSAAFSEAPRVTLDVRQLEQVDLTILQMICSACKTAAGQKISFRPAGDPPECVRAFAAGIGACMGSTCMQNNNETCIWFGGAK